MKPSARLSFLLGVVFALASPAAPAGQNATPSESTFVRRLTGHQTGVTHLAFLADGKRLLSVSRKGEIWLWDLKSRFLIRKFDAFGGSITRLLVDRRGLHAWTSHRDQYIDRWNIETGEKTHSLKLNRSPLRAMALSQDEKWLAVAGRPLRREARREAHGSESEALLIDPHTLKVIGNVTSEALISSVAFTMDNRYLAVGTQQTLELKPIKEGLASRRFSASDSPVTAVTVSPDGAKIAAVTADNTVCVWDIAAQRRVHSFKHASGVWQAMFLSGGRHLLSSSMDGYLRVWDVKTSQPIVIRKDVKRVMQTVAVSPSGHYIATAGDGLRISVSGSPWRGGQDNDIRIWRVPTAVKPAAKPDSKWRLESDTEKTEITTMLATNSLPYKMEAIRLLEEIGRRGDPVWAVNTLFEFLKQPQRTKDGVWIGRSPYNAAHTAIVGIAKDHQRAAKVALKEWLSLVNDAERKGQPSIGRRQLAIQAIGDVGYQHPYLEQVDMCLPSLMRYVRQGAGGGLPIRGLPSQPYFSVSMVALGEIGRTNRDLAKRVEPAIAEVVDLNNDARTRRAAVQIWKNLDAAK